MSTTPAPSTPAPTAEAEVLRRLRRMSRQLDQLLLATAATHHHHR